MPYIQLVEFNTKHQADEVRRAFDAWLDASRGQRTLRMAVVATDHDRPNHFWELLEYASEDDAAQVAEQPETKAARRPTSPRRRSSIHFWSASVLRWRRPRDCGRSRTV